MKKIISLLLILATVLSCVVLTVSADDMIVSDEGRLPFEDIKENHWFAPYIKFCYANGIIKGMTEHTVVPNGTLTRAQFVTMLCNLEGVDTSSYTVDTFTDVKASHWYYGAIAWAYSEGIVNGMNENTFAPNKTLTRAEFSSVMYSYMKVKYEVEVKEDVLDKFSDKPKTEYWYYEPIRYAVSAGLISGMANGTLSATGTVTRAQAAVVFEVFMKNYFYASCEHEFTGATCTESDVCEKCGLVKGLPDGHILSDYNCVSGGRCFICGVDTAPSKLLHDFAEATCTAPKTCKLCKLVKGEALGHDFSGDNCPRCGTASPFSRLRYAIKSHGEYYYDIHSCVLTNYYPEDNCTFYLAYDIALDRVYAATKYSHYNGDYSMTWLSLAREGSVHDLIYTYYTADEEIVFYGEGKIEATAYDKRTKLSFSYYVGDASNLESATTNFNYCVDYSVINLDFWGDNHCGVDAEDFWFLNY